MVVNVNKLRPLILSEEHFQAAWNLLLSFRRQGALEIVKHLLVFLPHVGGHIV